MIKLKFLVDQLDRLYGIKSLDKDPSMSRFVPMVYNEVQYDWEKCFESDFCSRYNGLMIRGGDQVTRVFCACFPANEVLSSFLTQAGEGDFLFLHHPIFMGCGDPKGRLGVGFRPINPATLTEIKAKKLSIYACHAPMDCHDRVGTNSAITAVLGIEITDKFLPYGNGFAGRIGRIDPISTDELTEKLKAIFNIPYVDLAGKKHDRIDKIAVVAGGGTDVADMQEAEKLGAQCYLSGEIINRVDNDYGRNNRAQDEEFAKVTKMSLVGVSHSASEFLVMRTQLPAWFKQTFDIEITPLPQSPWWQ